MKNIFYRWGAAALLSSTFLFTACEPEFEEDITLSRGDLDLSKYVALGNSLTAGFQDGALYTEGQYLSYPHLLASQFSYLGGGAFTQPYFAEGVSAGSPSAAGVPKRLTLQMVEDCLKNSSLSPAPSGPNGDMSVFAPISNPEAAYNNLGVPGARSFHLLAPGYGNPAGLATQPTTANPFFVRFAKSTTSSVLSDALAQNPTFFTLWIGNNDVLGYATAGGVGDQITPEATFKFAIRTLLNSLSKNGTGAKGAVANIPDVTKVPFFTTVPYNALALDATKAQQLTGYYQQIGKPEIKFSAGANPFVVEEDGVVRQLTSEDYVLMTIPQNDIKCNNLGSITPIPDRYVLSKDEVKLVRDNTQLFNDYLEDEANRLGLAYVDFNDYMNRLSGGLTMNGVTYNPTLVTGNVFSLDGIHFTPRGAALVANEFITTINAKYGSTIPTIDVTQFRAVLIP